MFRHIYSNLELSKDDNFIKNTLNKFSLFDRSIYDYCLKECLEKYKKWEISQNKIREDIDLYSKRLSHLIKLKNKTKYESREIYKVNNRISRLKNRLGKQIVFGGLSRLQNVTMFKNNDDVEKYQKYLKEYKEHRILGLYCIGRACEGGNRKFDFNLLNDEITFKPNRKVKFKLKIKAPRNLKQSALEKIQFLVNQNEIPITVRLFKGEIQLIIDNERLNNFHFNEKDCKKECEGKSKEDIKLIYKKWYDEQRERKQLGKVENRIGAIDLNPKNIGFSIIEIKDGIKPTILYTRSYNLNRLISKKRRNKIGNNTDKLRYEISKIYQQIFTIMKVFKCSKFSMEDLDFKNKNQPQSKEFNRLTKNIWCRKYQENLINKYCQNIGIELVLVNPIYSSFIGNVLYDYFDPISSSIEIGRRGIYKYIKGASLYPPIEWIPKEKMYYLLESSSNDEEALTWIKLYKLVLMRNLRYRNLEKSKEARFMNKGSDVYVCL